MKIKGPIHEHSKIQLTGVVYRGKAEGAIKEVMWKLVKIKEPGFLG
jgi:hypothetical protein